MKILPVSNQNFGISSKNAAEVLKKTSQKLSETKNKLADIKNEIEGLNNFDIDDIAIGFAYRPLAGHPSGAAYDYINQAKALTYINSL